MGKKARKYAHVVGFLMVICLFFGTLAGCVDGTESEVTTSDQTDDSNNKIKIIENGVALYTLVYPKNSTKATQSAMERFVNGIEEATGVKLTAKTDYIERGAIRDSASREILFGRTDYEETESVLKELDKDQFAIRAVGNKIVITSPSDDNLEAAVSYFCDTMINNLLIEESSGMKTL